MATTLVFASIFSLVIFGLVLAIDFTRYYRIQTTFTGSAIQSFGHCTSAPRCVYECEVADDCEVAVFTLDTQICETFTETTNTNEELQAEPPDNVRAYKKTQRIVQKECDAESGWVTFEGSCYKLFHEYKSWSEAEDWCISLDAHLAVITSEAEDSFIWTVITGNFVWIGGICDYDPSGCTWRWVNGEPWNYTNWANGYVLSSTVESLALIVTNKEWINTGPTPPRNFMCEF